MVSRRFSSDRAVPCTTAAALGMLVGGLCFVAVFFARQAEADGIAVRTAGLKRADVHRAAAAEQSDDKRTRLEYGPQQCLAEQRAAAQCAAEEATGAENATEKNAGLAAADDGAKAPAAMVEVARDELYDRLYGGWVGMLIGGLEGLPHEFKYIDEPRDALPEFAFLPRGARSDDDNDFEWTHLWFMDQENTIALPYERVVAIWKANMNQGIWMANKKARELMDEGVVPPETGSAARNPHAWYNLSGQFCVEAYGLIAPGMPQTAAEIGLHYARIAVSEEPLQATQFWTALVSESVFDRGPIDRALRRAVAAADRRSAMAEVVADALAARTEHPDDWKAARQAIHRKWVEDRKWNRNSTPVNGAAVCLALLYGDGDFYRTLQLAMALGYDADCNAATAGAVVGARWGFRRIAALPQFRMPDRYVNATRPQLPGQCKVSEQADLLLRLAERVVLAHGGERTTTDNRPGYRIARQEPKNLEPLPERPRQPTAVAR